MARQTQKFKGSLKRRFNNGDIGQDVHTKVRYKRPENKPIKISFWQKWFKSKWFRRLG